MFDFFDFKYLLKEDYYLYVPLDAYYLKMNTLDFHIYHKVHTALLYGFDEEKNEYAIGDHFVTGWGKYFLSTAGIGDVVDATSVF